VDLFSLDPGLAIWTWVSFAILCGILTKWVFPALLKNLKDRETLIARSVDDAQQIDARLKAIEQERIEILRKAQSDAESLLQKVREDADVLKHTLQEEAEREAAAIVAQGKARMVEERQALIEALREELAEFVLTCAGTVVGSTLSGAREREWSRDLVKRL
jgi:F-type H+-transporting ATPase subunit b